MLNKIRLYHVRDFAFQLYTLHYKKLQGFTIEGLKNKFVMEDLKNHINFSGLTLLKGKRPGKSEVGKSQVKACITDLNYIIKPDFGN